MRAASAGLVGPGETLSMIARTFLAVALMGLTAGCATAQKGLPIVRVDAEHIMARRSGGAEAPAYVIRSREGLILDATGYKFPSPTDPARATPTVIQLIVDQRGLYDMPWQAGAERYSLTAATLLPRSGSAPFGGFRRGDRLILAIGHEQPAQRGRSDFYLLWAGAIDVR